MLRRIRVQAGLDRRGVKERLGGVESAQAVVSARDLLSVGLVRTDA